MTELSFIDTKFCTSSTKSFISTENHYASFDCTAAKTQHVKNIYYQWRDASAFMQSVSQYSVFESGLGVIKFASPAGSVMHSVISFDL